MSTILGGVAWGLQQSDWKISHAEQIRVEGNQYLSDKTVRSLLAIPYPKLIMELAPEQLTAKLLAQGSISSAKIDRGLLPPHLIVQVQDLPPVARVIADHEPTTPGLVDESGRQLPLTSYRATVLAALPRLQLRLPQSGRCPDWSQLYRLIQTSPVAIGTIDCRNPQNLFLETEIGRIRLGTTGDKARLTSQIQQIDRLRDWQKHPDAATAEYLDLDNPESPKIQIKPGPPDPVKSILNQQQ